MKDEYGAFGGTVLTRGKPKFLEFGKSLYPSSTLSTINSTWTGLKSNPGLSGQISATHCLIYGMVKFMFIWECIISVLL
jgi:hypothetical protein